MDEKIEKKKQPEIQEAGIDKDVLEKMVKENVLTATKDDIQMNRVMLNCMCEMLSQFQQMNKAFAEFSNILSICGADKLTDFFKKLKVNVDNEVTRQNVQKQIKKSHKKAKKSDNVVEFSPKNVK